MELNNSVIKHYLRNCLFITGTAYAGKSTMCKMLAEQYGLIHCRENYMLDEALKLVTPDEQPNLSYFLTKRDWQEYLNRTPEEYANWINGNAREITSFEIAELIRISEHQKVIVDTNIPLDVLRNIAGYHQVAVMLSPQKMSVDSFFDRADPEKQFLLSQIRESDNPEQTMSNFRECIARVNSPEQYDTMKSSGFFTLVRENTETDTRCETAKKLALHFGLSVCVQRLTPCSAYWNELIQYAQNCSWEFVGPHLADIMRRDIFTEWESVFVCFVNGEIAGFCTFLKEDFYSENRYSPWISTIFVDEKFRGYRLSHRMIDSVITYAKSCGFSKVYIPSDMNGFYEKCGFTPIDTLTNYIGDTDTIFMKEI